MSGTPTPKEHAKLLRRLFEPARLLTDPVERLRQRLLLRLLLVLAVLGGAGILLYELTARSAARGLRTELVLQLVGLVVLLVIYLVARAGASRLARAVVLGIPVACVLAMSVLRSPGQDAGVLTLYLLLTILLGAALLTLRQAAVLTVLVLAIAAVLPALAPSLLYDADQLNRIAYVAFMGGLVLVTARHREELERVRQAQVRQSEQRYRLVAENTTDIVFRQDMQMVITYVSPSVEKTFGFTVAEGLRKTMPELMTPGSLERATTMFADYAVRAQHEDLYIPLMEYEYVKKDGSTFWGELRVSFLRDDAGKLVGSQGILRDVSERKHAEAERMRLEEHLRDADKMRLIGQLAGGVAHDFNNQLAGIRGSAEVLLRREVIRADRQLYELTQTIVQAADRSAQLTRQLLAFARKASVHAAAIDLRDLVRDVVSMLEHSTDKRFHVHVAIDDPQPITFGDAAQLHSALLNVALNARDAMPDGGELRIAVTRGRLDRARGEELGFDIEPGVYLALSAKDSGQGMDAATRTRMFEPFFTTKDQGRGTGMGLAVVDGTVRAHGGAIDVTSAPGRGTTVTLYLRVAPDSVEVRDAPPPPARAARSGTILLVDDEDVARSATASLLETLGYRVHSCRSGSEALELFRQKGADIDGVLLDVVMPEPGGLTVLREMLSVRPDARVVLMSGYTETRGPAGSGARAFLPKPFSLAELTEALEQALGSSSRVGQPADGIADDA
jgi:PAS domain S-box-containing protein